MNEGRTRENASASGAAIDPDRVLIADHDERCRKALARALRDAGHHVTTAQNCEDLEPCLADPGLGVLIADPQIFDTGSHCFNGPGSLQARAEG